MLFKKYKLINPMLVIFMLLISNILLHFLFPNIYGPIKIEIILIILIYLVSFFFGFYFVYSIFIKKKIHFYQCYNRELIFNRKYVLIYYLVLIITSYLLYQEIINSGVMGIMEYRLLVNNNFLEKGTLFWILRIFSLLFFISLINFIYSKTILQSYWWAFLCLYTSLITTGRNYLLFFFLTLFITIINGKNVITKLIIGFVFFILLFATYAILFNKIGENESILLGSLHSLISYFTVPLYGLSQIFEEKNLGSIMLLSEGVLNLLNIPHEAVPPMDYTKEPFVTNVYTLFFPIYYDLSYFGIVFFGIVYGFIHKLLYIKARYGGIWLYLYCISLYPLFMTVFHDTYLSSIGLWAVALLALLLFKENRSLNVQK